MAKEWIDPDTGQVYDLSHLRPMEVSYQIKHPDGTVKPVSARVHFSAHCHTRTRKSGDADHHVAVTETRSGGNTEERVFCADRWDFSLQLPKIIRELADKGCLQGKSNEFFYRQEGATLANRHHGWYLCIRMRYYPKQSQPLQLSVRSVHYRTNRPNDIRGHGTQRFKVLLAKVIAQKS